MDTWEEMAGDDGRSTGIWANFGHEALQHLLVVVVITCEGLQLAFQTHFHSQSQLRVFQADKVTWRRTFEKRSKVRMVHLVGIWLRNETVLEHLCPLTTGTKVLPRGPLGFCLNCPFLPASSMAVKSEGMCSPKRRRRLERLLSMFCRFLLLASMDFWNTSCSLLETKGGHYVRLLPLHKCYSRARRS